MGKNKDQIFWKENLKSGIRNQSLLNLMWVELKLYEQYDNERKTMHTHKTKIRFLTFLKDKERLKDIQSILNCSERTARDYLNAVFYLNLMNKSKLELYQRTVMEQVMENIKE